MTFFRGSALLIGAVATLAACQAGQAPSGIESAALTPAGSDKVFVCHFRGHASVEEGVVVFQDFVTTAPTGGRSICDSRGGNVIEVTPAACVNGHAATGCPAE